MDFFSHILKSLCTSIMIFSSLPLCIFLSRGFRPSDIDVDFMNLDHERLSSEYRAGALEVCVGGRCEFPAYGRGLN